jgi:hypothetical protein
MDIRKFAVSPTARLHLRDAAEQLMYADSNSSKPMAVNLFGPGSKEYAKADAERSNRMLEMLKNKGKPNQSAADKAEVATDFLVACTESFENLEYDKLTGVDLARAVYSDVTIGFIADQAGSFIGDWGNFTKPSTKG